MTDPILRINGNLIELEYNGHSQYIRKEFINSISSTTHSVSITIRSDAKEAEWITFTTREKQKLFLSTITTAISEKDPASQHLVAKLNKDMADCLRIITDKLKKFKDDIHEELRVELDSIKECVKKVEERLGTLEETSTDEEAQEKYEDLESESELEPESDSAPVRKAEPEPEPVENKYVQIHDDDTEEVNICFFAMIGSAVMSLFTTLSLLTFNNSLIHE
jgi:hypothetical protein